MHKMSLLQKRESLLSALRLQRLFDIEAPFLAPTPLPSSINKRSPEDSSPRLTPPLSSPSPNALQEDSLPRPTSTPLISIIERSPRGQFTKTHPHTSHLHHRTLGPRGQFTKTHPHPSHLHQRTLPEDSSPR